MLVCFFLPWVQVSCAGGKETLSGLDLARQVDPLLWLVPLLICAVLVFGLVRMRRASPQIYGFLSAASGLVIVFLINRQRGRVLDESGLLPAHLTGWFWLAFISAIVTVISAAAMLLRPKTAAGDQDRV